MAMPSVAINESLASRGKIPIQTLSDNADDLTFTGGLVAPITSNLRSDGIVSLPTFANGGSAVPTTTMAWSGHHSVVLSGSGLADLDLFTVVVDDDDGRARFDDVAREREHHFSRRDVEHLARLGARRDELIVREGGHGGTRERDAEGDGECGGREHGDAQSLRGAGAGRSARDGGG